VSVGLLYFGLALTLALVTVAPVVICAVREWKRARREAN